jgi:hypothetical protein
MPTRKPEALIHRAEPVALLAGNQLTASLPADDDSAAADLLAQLGSPVEWYLDDGAAEQAARHLCDFRILAARVALERNIQPLLADLRAIGAGLGTASAEVDALVNAPAAGRGRAAGLS